MLDAVCTHGQRAGSRPAQVLERAGSAGVCVKPCAVRNRPISNSGFGVGSMRRNSFST